MTIIINHGTKQSRGHIVEDQRTICGHDLLKLTVTHTEDVQEYDAAKRIRLLGSTPCGKCWEAQARRLRVAKLRAEGKIR